MDGDGDGDGGLWLTQSRPITTLYPLPVPTRPSLRVYVCVSLAQGLTRPMTPMGLSACRVITSTGAVRAFGVPVDDPLASRVGRPVMLAALDVMEARSAVVLRGLLREPELSVLTTSLARSLWPFVRRVLRVVVGFRMPPLLALSLLRPAAARRHVGRIGERLRATTAPAGADLGADATYELQRELAAFLRECGHRAVAEIDLGMPRRSDARAGLAGQLPAVRRSGPCPGRSVRRGTAARAS